MGLNIRTTTKLACVDYVYVLAQRRLYQVFVKHDAGT